MSKGENEPRFVVINDKGGYCCTYNVVTDMVVWLSLMSTLMSIGHMLHEFVTDVVVWLSLMSTLCLDAYDDDIIC